MATRSLTPNGDPAALKAGKALTDSDWQEYADSSGFNHEGGKCLVSLSGERQNGYIRPITGSSQAKPVLRVNTWSLLSFNLDLPHGYTRFGLAFNVKCLLYQYDNANPKTGQNVEIALIGGATEQRLALFFPAGALGADQNGDGIAPTGGNLVVIGNNAQTNGIIYGTLDAKLWANANSTRPVHLVVRNRYLAGATITASQLDWKFDSQTSAGNKINGTLTTAAGYWDGLDSLQLYLYPDGDREDY